VLSARKVSGGLSWVDAVSEGIGTSAAGGVSSSDPVLPFLGPGAPVASFAVLKLIGGSESSAWVPRVQGVAVWISSPVLPAMPADRSCDGCGSIGLW